MKDKNPVIFDSVRPQNNIISNSSTLSPYFDPECISNRSLYFISSNEDSINNAN